LGRLLLSTALTDAITSAGSAGIIFVAAAGNNGANNDATPFYPASYKLDNLVAVAATTSYDALASFSNYGSNSVHLRRPAMRFTQLLPRATAPTLRPAARPWPRRLFQARSL